MGKRPSTAIAVPHRHPFCPALSYDEWERLAEKIGLEEIIALGFRVTERDSMLKAGKKSVPKHRLSPDGSDWP